MILSFIVSIWDYTGEKSQADLIAAVEEGRLVYKENCASCHGENLQGEAEWQTQKKDGTLPAPPHDDSGHTWHHDDPLLFNYTKRGGQAVIGEGFKSSMPGFEGVLSDDQIRAVLSFIKDKWSEEAKIYQAKLTAAKMQAE